MFNNGLCYGLPTIVIATLGGIANEHNSNEFLSMTPIQATWMGKCEIALNHSKHRLTKFVCIELDLPFFRRLHSIHRQTIWMPDVSDNSR